MKTKTKASEILDELVLAYLRLQIESSKQNMDIAIRTDYIRANFRNKISNFTGIDGHVIQNHIESIASDYVCGNISIKDSIKKALSL